jgi:hypothetical protein
VSGRRLGIWVAGGAVAVVAAFVAGVMSAPGESASVAPPAAAPRAIEIPKQARAAAIPALREPEVDDSQQASSPSATGQTPGSQGQAGTSPTPSAATPAPVTPAPAPPANGGGDDVVGEGL